MLEDLLKRDDKGERKEKKIFKVYQNSDNNIIGIVEKISARQI
jgi:hypothetical protein